MSRSALFVAGALFAAGVLVWLLLAGRDRVPPSPAATVPEAPALPPPPVARAPAPASTAPANVPARTAPRITTRDEFVAALKSAGRDGEKLVAAYQDWRIARGYLDADPLTGTTAGNAPIQVYSAVDPATLRSLANSGELGAIQAYAAGSLPSDPFTAIDYYGRASRLGSAAAMGRIAGILADLGTLEAGDDGIDRAFASRLLNLRGGEPHRDLRQDAVAWTLAAIRLHGPITATPAGLALAEELARNPDEAVVNAICGRSLAILADLSASGAGQGGASLPPAFLAEQDLYDRLPCRDTPAPVTPPRALERCSPSPAIGSGSRPVELWVCQEN